MQEKHQFFFFWKQSITVGSTIMGAKVQVDTGTVQISSLACGSIISPGLGSVFAHFLSYKLMSQLFQTGYHELQMQGLLGSAEYVIEASTYM
jgi:hypothetical protein